jgi:acyl dehydratase
MGEPAKGTVIFDRTWPGADREKLRRFSQGTEDPNPIHVDDDFAKRAGFPAVLQQGPMTTAHFAHLLAETFGAARLRSLDINFTAPVFLGDALRLTATVVSDGGDVVVALAAAKLDGTATAKGQAVIAPA